MAFTTRRLVTGKNGGHGLLDHMEALAHRRGAERLDLGPRPDPDPEHLRRGEHRVDLPPFREGGSGS